MIHKYTFTKENGATVFVSEASTLSGAIEKAGLTDAKFTYIRTPIGNDIARPVVADSKSANDRYALAKRYFSAGFSIGYGGADITEDHKHFDLVWNRLERAEVDTDQGEW